ncbi:MULTISPECIES: nuclease-related domain-containing protein [unclassified Paraburkholderia]|uniref:nuclease-related domain-containing protein n=1 Tax=unclassified Paraburkholderia TaxID=2615204 RepID=UPI002AB27D04|nr:MULTISPECIES: nuclease-related domain-containing protein [unclassified Paraburkholderia]
MSGLFVLLVLGYLGYRLSKRVPGARRRMGSPWRQPAPSTPPATRAQVSGEAGEAAVGAELRRVLTWLCGDNFHLHDGAVLLHHAPGTAFPTAEIDHLVVAPFGIFVIETKNWSGTIAPASAHDEIVRTGHNGTPELRRSPLAQNRTKVAFLNDRLPRVWPIEGLAVFSSPACTLHPDLPMSIVHISELAHWMRERRHTFDLSGRRPVNVKTAWQAIMLNTSISETELDLHRERLRSVSKVLANDAV